MNTKSRLTFNNRPIFFFFKNWNFIKVNLPTHACFRRNWKLFLILKFWNYRKCKVLLHTLNVYKIPAKEHKVVDHWAADEISVLQIMFWKYLEYISLILCNSERVKRGWIVIFTLSSFLSVQYVLVTNSCKGT